jgi:transglutaminase-like putative cysteine protease
MKLNIAHQTHYTYAEQVRRSTQYLRLTPLESSHQHIVSWTLTLPEEALCTTDAFGNILHVLTLDQPHQDITIKASGVVDIDTSTCSQDTHHLSPLVFLRHSQLTQPDQAIREFALRFYRKEAPLASLESLMTALLQAMPYQPGATQVTDTAAQSFAAQQGVCQDHTHVFLACCRSLHIPARYVSGYLHSSDTEHVAMHAWAEVWIDHQWHSFDITNNTRCPSQHLKLAVGIDYLDACPVRGVRLGGGSENMQAVAAVHMFTNNQ